MEKTVRLGGPFVILSLGGTRPSPQDCKYVSSEESVGEVRFGKGSESVIERVFVGFLCTETVGFSGDQF